MSAYALSGALFPPIGTLPTGDASTCSPPSASSSNAIHKNFITLSCSSSVPGTGTQAKQASCSTGRREVGIEVKAARIDPMRLIHPQTGRSKLPPKGTNTRKLLHKGQDRVLGCSNEAGTPTDPHRKNEDRQPNNEEGSDPTRRSSCEIGTPHGDAIQFELSISLNGRVYSATRTLPRIIQLRNELIRELDVRRKGSRLRRMRWRRKPEALDRSLVKDDDTVETVDEDAELDQDLEIFIPELPDCIVEKAETVAAGGFGSRGFRMVQALLRSYCPAVERWLRYVADVVPPNSSPCLTNFLWEPLSQSFGSQATKESNQSNMRSSKAHGSLSTLDSIDEAHDGMSEEDESDTEHLDVKVLFFEESCSANFS